MKTKIVYEDYNKETGVSTVTIQNKYGRFTGIAHCHPDDMENFSMFAGERYAATYAEIEFIKFRINQEKAKRKALKDLLLDFHCNEDHKLADYVGPLSDHALKMIEVYSNNIEDYKKVISFLKYSIKTQDAERQNVLLRTNKSK